MFTGIGVITVGLLVFIYTRINARRDAQAEEATEKGITYSVEQLREMGDRAPDFRYTL